MKLFCAIAMCSIAYADISNLETLITNCSDASRVGRLRVLQRRLSSGETNIAACEGVLLALSPHIQNINRVIMENESYQEYARKLVQMPGLLNAIIQIKKAEGVPTTPEHQITVKQLTNEIASAIYLLPEIIMAIEVLEKDLEQGNFDRLRQSGELVFRDFAYEDFVETIKILGTHKILLLAMIKDLQDIRTPLIDLTTENTCSTREAYGLAGMTYRD